MSGDQPQPSPQPYQTHQVPQTYPGRGGQQEPAQYRYTESELQAMKECRSESFWYRSLPLMVSGALLTKYLINRGVLTVRYGSLPKMIAGGAIGYFAGIFSYVNKCNEKIMKLENSPLADMLRQRKSGVRTPMPMPAPGSSIPPPPVGGVYNADPSSEFGGVQVSGYQSDDAHVNMDIDTSNVKRIDDYQELPQEEQTEQAKAEMTTTYQELRSKNRSQRPIYQSQYAPQQPSQQGQPGSYQWQPQQSPPARSPPQRKSQDDDEFSLGRKSRKNKYGDDWE